MTDINGIRVTGAQLYDELRDIHRTLNTINQGMLKEIDEVHQRLNKVEIKVFGLFGALMTVLLTELSFIVRDLVRGG